MPDTLFQTLPLPIVDIDGQYYFVDERLRQIYLVDDPHAYWNFPEGADIGEAVIAFRNSRGRQSFFGKGEPGWLPLKLRSDL